MSIALSVVIVNWNTREHLRACLRSIYAHPPNEPFEIWVVDNASSDGSVQMVRDEFPQVRLIANEQNMGYGRANNLALGQARGEFALILNSDIEVTPNALQTLVDFMRQHPDAHAAGGQLLLPDGSIQPSCSERLTLWAVFCEQSLLAKAFPRSRLFGGYTLTWWSYDSVREVEQVVGACLMLRRQADGSFPLFDERYFMYAEDTELCHRIRQGGGRIYYVPHSRFKHHLGASSEQESVRTEMVKAYNRSRILFFREVYGAWSVPVYRLLIAMGASVRLALWTGAWLLGKPSRPHAARHVAMFWEVLKDAWRSQVDPMP
ncbi:MAG: glycosyltransferase family 2 protein [Armatimonadota bacterium]|nr:glycosyltransferase family 2 protein [bacterium]MDW8320083.1 glycosyltransferase family 2 protein [Armatimonadota bacterium]